MQDTSACVHPYLVETFLNEMKRGGNVRLWMERGRLRLFQWHLHWYFYWLWSGVSKWREDFVIWKKAKILILIIIRFLKDPFFFFITNSQNDQLPVSMIAQLKLQCRIADIKDQMWTGNRETTIADTKRSKLRTQIWKTTMSHLRTQM